VVKADAHAVLGGQDDVAVLIAHLNVDELVLLLDVDTANSGSPDVPIGGENRLLHRAMAGGEDEALLVAEFPNRYQCGDLVVGLHGDAVDHRLTASGPPGLGDLVHLQPVHLTPVAEKHQVIMGARNEEVLHPILGLEVRAVQPATPAALPFVGGDRDSLDVAAMGDGDHHVFFGDQILDRKLSLVGHNLGPAVIPESLADFLHLLLEDGHPLWLGCQDALQLLDRGADLLELGVQLFDLEAGELG